LKKDYTILHENQGIIFPGIVKFPLTKDFFGEKVTHYEYEIQSNKIDKVCVSSTYRIRRVRWDKFCRGDEAANRGDK
jgi:hypothetical protein